MTYFDYMSNSQRDDDSLTAEELIAAYLQGVDTLRAAINGMSAEQLVARPIAYKWSTIEVVSHIADTEIYFTDRIERTIALDRPILMGVDERPYPSRLYFQSLDINEELDLFQSLRRHAARILRLQPAEAWSRTAVHTETGLVTLRQLVLQPIRHLAHHLPFIAEKRAALTSTL